jgi:hypothetical protein
VERPSVVHEGEADDAGSALDVLDGGGAPLGPGRRSAGRRSGRKRRDDDGKADDASATQL